MPSLLPEEREPEPVEKPPQTQSLTLSESMRLSSAASVGLLIFVCIFGIYAAKPVLLPVIFAILLSFILRPIHSLLLRLRLPRVLAAALLLFGLAAGAVYLSLALAPAVVNWLDRLPRNMYRIETKLRELRAPMTALTEMAQRVDELASGEEETTEEAATPRQERVSDQVWAGVRATGGYAVVVFILLFFILAFGGTIHRKLAQDEELADYLDEIGRSISAYLFTITIINTCLGVAIGAAMYMLGMPNPVLWGFVAAALNFVPFLGAVAGTVLISFVAFLTFDSLWEVLRVPLAYYGLTVLEGSFLTPMILGRRFTINPIVIFVWLLFWGWLWGLPGALIAVPLLMAFKISCEHIGPLAWISYVISMEPRRSITGTPPKEAKTQEGVPADAR